MSLQEKTTEFQQQARARMPEDVLKRLLDDTQQVVASGVVAQALKVGDHAPPFVLPNAVGEIVASDVLLRKGFLVLNFYRGAWCPYCNLELRALQDTLLQIQALGANLVAISPNLPDKSLTSIEKHALTFEVLTDVQNQTAHNYGLVLTLDAEIRPLYRQIGFDIPAHNGDESWELPIAATYVVAPDGVIVYAFVSADYTQRAEPDAILAALATLSHAVS